MPRGTRWAAAVAKLPMTAPTTIARSIPAAIEPFLSRGAASHGGGMEAAGLLTLNEKRGRAKARPLFFPSPQQCADSDGDYSLHFSFQRFW